MRKLFTSATLGDWALAGASAFATLWWIFSVSSVGSEAKAIALDAQSRINMQGNLIQETHDAVLIIKKDIEYMKKERRP